MGGRPQASAMEIVNLKIIQDISQERELLVVDGPELNLKPTGAPASAGRSASRTTNQRSTTMKSSTQDKVEGQLHEAKGKIKEVAGKIVGNKDLELKGKDENLAGKVQEKVGQIKTVLGK
jgi:uncharacterized protein YjbJ (UPF0337 family)